MMLPELPEGMQGLRIMVGEPPPVRSVAAEVTLPASQVIGLQYLAALGYAAATGDPTRALPQSHLYVQVALRSRKGGLDDMLAGMRDLFIFLSARNGAPPDVANAMAGSLGVVASIVGSMDEFDDEAEQGGTADDEHANT